MSLLRLVGGRLGRVLVFSADTAMIRPPEAVAGLTVRSLGPDALHALSTSDPSFRASQLRRLKRFGASYAYGVFADGQVAHLSWLLPPSAIALDHPRVIHGRAGEGEITGCETLPEFRGRGIFGFAIRSLAQTARARGLLRIFMKTATDNLASQSAITKAGFVQVGTATVFTFPGLPNQVIRRHFR